ncbi:MAG: hypothetical protein WEB52_13395 [Dehalococcoidia bacterium]
MSIDATRHLRALNRYRLMFMTSLGMGSFGAALILAGMLAWAVGPFPDYLPWGMGILGVAMILGWMVTSSTTRILERAGFFGHRR